MKTFCSIKKFSASILTLIFLFSVGHAELAYKMCPSIESSAANDCIDVVMKDVSLPAGLIDSIFAAAEKRDLKLLGNFLTNPKLAKRAMKLLSAMDKAAFKNSAKACAMGDGKIAVFFECGSGRLPAGMNFMEISSAKWNPSSADPLARMIAQDLKSLQKSDISAKESSPEFFYKKESLKLARMPQEKLEKNAAYIFYKQTQDLFYALDFDSFKSRLCPQSLKRYDAAYGSLTKDQMAQNLKDYLKVSKEYLCVWDFNNYALVFFKYANSEEVHVGYVLKNPDGMKIANYISDQTPFDKFAAEYFGK